jgi:hypothetical protein
MKVIEDGTRYLVQFFNKEEGQVIQFTTRSAEGGYVDGVTNEEILEMMIDRLRWLDGRNPCEENAFALLCLENARRVLGKRLKKKQVRTKSHDK